MNPSIGTKVYLRAPLPYLKTSDPMPMLRPADLIAPGELGEVVEIRPKGIVAVRFRRGTFLIPSEGLDIKASESDGFI